MEVADLVATAKAGRTVMTQRGFPSDELPDEHAIGLPTAFDNLARVVADSAP